MKKKIFIISGLAIFLVGERAFAQSSSESDKAQPQTTVYTAEQVTVDSRIPSAYQFMIGMCELKEGVYYMPRTKFTGLTESQQKYVRDNDSLFVIKD